MARVFPFPLPVGWYAVAHSDGLAPGAVRALRYFGRDLVAFREEEGPPHVLGAHCPHLGAHLGHGGRVAGRALRCPFHGWEWDGGTGACLRVPYTSRVPAAARATTYPTVERNGFVFAWYHPRGGAPWFEIPELPEATSPEWSRPQRFEWTVRSRNQELGENGVDSAHFRFVHGTLNVPTPEVSADGPFRRNLQPVKLRTPRGDVEGGIDSTVYGMGFAATRFTGICETLELATSTPIDEERVHVRYAFVQPRVDGHEPTGGVAAAIIRDIVKQMNEDIPIWENKIFRPDPVLCDGDGPIAEYRRWCRQFYASG